MAEKPSGKIAPKSPKGFFEEFGWFVWGLLGLGFLWFFMGGYENQIVSRPYIKPAAPLDSGQTYGKTYITDQVKEKETLDLPPNPITIIRNIDNGLRGIFFSPKKKILMFDGTTGAKESDPQKEYVTVLANFSNQSSIKLTGLNLKSRYNKTDIKIPQATIIPILGTPYTKDDVIMDPGDQAIIASGKSPIGTSFKVNICSGYMDQFQNFTPTLKHNCPEPKDELENYAVDYGLQNDSSCKEFVKTLPRCRIYNGSFPVTISASCKAFVTEKLNYNSCVKKHGVDEPQKKFYLPEWRIFLGQTKELWLNKDEEIRLIDASDKEKEIVIDSVDY